ncbi:unnamed protein product [Rotaria socialis]|uniref:Uncharacterized protein n=1 Tax=Rotaria socialis TaxID=392032 RepID=A0A818WH69_9BILA|nr:unnamed protein product [Rotaria socialis]CAF4475458.1 unnamed protein product [Rotaria socialis]
MATSTTKHKTNKDKPEIQNGLALAWLDDSVSQDPNAKDIFRSLFEQVFIFTDPGACLEVVESADSEKSCISVLVSGKYGQMLVPDRLQPLPQVKNIYVYCFDITKHNQWAHKCDKVRCVDSDLGKIFKCIQHDVHNIMKQQYQSMDDQPEQMEEQEQQEFVATGPERFTVDNNFYNQLALDILLKNSDDDRDDDDDDGAVDFKKYCETHMGNKNQDRDKEEIVYFQPNTPIEQWYKDDLCFLNLNSTNFTQLWTLRWFIRSFYRQLTKEHECFMNDKTTIKVDYGTWLTTDELNTMKFRIGETIIFTEFFKSYASRRNALDSIKNEKTEEKNNKVIFEINVEKNNRTVPYSEIQDDLVLFWFGSRHRIMKIEYVETQGAHPDSYWLIGLNLCATLDVQQSMKTLYGYYRKKLTDLKDRHYAFGRILIYKGLYYEAEKWLQTNNHYQDLAELAIRQNQLERANQYLQHLPEDSDDANLLRAYVYLLSSQDNIAKGRTLLMKIDSDATDKMLRARISIALGFVNIIGSHQNEPALDYFTIGSEALCKMLPDIHPDVAKSYIGIGYAHFTGKNIKEAEKCFQMALIIQKQSLPNMHPDIAKTRNGIARCLSVKKQTVKKALEEFQHAYNILMHTFPRENKKHPEISLTVADITKLRKGKELYSSTTLLDYI